MTSGHLRHKRSEEGAIGGLKINTEYTGLIKFAHRLQVSLTQRPWLG